MKIFDFEKHRKKLDEYRNIYKNAEVFPHIIIEDFAEGEAVERALDEFPKIKDEGWTHYKHFNEKKGGLNKREYLPDIHKAVIDEFNSPEFVSFLSELTGIPDLIPDLSMEGGGLHQIEKGGFLNIHADYTAHPHHRLWRRRVNLLLYLNKDWHEEYGGALELWTKDMKRPFTKIMPLFNRCVIFNTDTDSYHGHPHPLSCPEDRTRKSIALYYFTVESEPPVKMATNYKARPGDGAKAVLIYMDNKVLSIYNRLKGVLGINDDFASRILRKISRLWERKN